ncbi:uncharacterized protein BXZ73DRAFT_102695 [Epithele typhae]|uniref:uncharacterized protein n=1 Tax=Epithele typhae TaxID=378194 RepID=UPI002008B351|nr:uncharacterized protein BXZ73DRAFT_102695 [Epithele typhae]KAH9927104.1 hypothetical protein BXZ73DRAFT_102695 [Epithele typhae]
MPLDIVLEVFSHMHPRDLLTLARTTRSFRDFLMSRKSRSYWKASRGLVPHLPDIPSFLSEPAYAHLVFNTACHAMYVCLETISEKTAFVKHCAELVKERLEHQAAMLKYQMAADCAREAEIESLRKARFEDIKRRLSDEGWATDIAEMNMFDHYKLSKLPGVNKKQPLTDRALSRPAALAPDDDLPPAAFDAALATHLPALASAWRTRCTFAFAQLALCSPPSSTTAPPRLAAAAFLCTACGAQGLRFPHVLAHRCLSTYGGGPAVVWPPPQDRYKRAVLEWCAARGDPPPAPPTAHFLVDVTHAARRDAAVACGGDADADAGAESVAALEALETRVACAVCRGLALVGAPYCEAFAWKNATMHTGGHAPVWTPLDTETAGAVRACEAAMPRRGFGCGECGATCAHEQAVVDHYVNDHVELALGWLCTGAPRAGVDYYALHDPVRVYCAERASALGGGELVRMIYDVQENRGVTSSTLFPEFESDFEHPCKQEDTDEGADMGSGNRIPKFYSVLYY